MQISIDDFRQESGTASGPPWWVDPEGCDFTLSIPEGDQAWEPHEPSYRLAMDVLAELDAMKAKAVDYLARIIDFEKVGIGGEPYLVHVHCDARAERVTLEMSWEANVNGAWSVTFFWRDGTPRRRQPVGMAMRSR